MRLLGVLVALLVATTVRAQTTTTIPADCPVCIDGIQPTLTASGGYKKPTHCQCRGDIPNNETIDGFADDLFTRGANVRAPKYAADNTGGSDATAAIQSAVNDVCATGAITKRVFIPAGTYLLSDMDPVDGAAIVGCAGLDIGGAGEEATQLTSNSGVAVDYIRLGSMTPPMACGGGGTSPCPTAVHFAVHDLGVRFPVGGIASVGVHVIDPSYGVLEHLSGGFSSGTGTGARAFLVEAFNATVPPAGNITVRDVFASNSNDGTQLPSSRGLAFIGHTVAECTGSGLPFPCCTGAGTGTATCGGKLNYVAMEGFANLENAGVSLDMTNVDHWTLTGPWQIGGGTASTPAMKISSAQDFTITGMHHWAAVSEHLNIDSNSYDGWLINNLCTSPLTPCPGTNNGNRVYAIGGGSSGYLTSTGPWLDTGTAGSAQANVRAYGAKCDGVSNDSPAFQAANNALVDGGVILVPPCGAKYILASLVTIGPHRTIGGSGEATSWVKCTHAGFCFQFSSSSDGYQGAENLTVEYTTAGAFDLVEPNRWATFKKVDVVGPNAATGIAWRMQGQTSCNCFHRFSQCRAHSVGTGIALSGFANANDIQDFHCATVGLCMGFEKLGSDTLGGQDNVVLRTEMDGSTTLGIRLRDDADRNTFIKLVDDGATNSMDVGSGVDGTTCLGCVLGNNPIGANIAGVTFIGSAYEGNDRAVDRDRMAGGLLVTGEAEVSGIAGDGAGKAVCLKADGKLGTCSTVPNGSGVCTCG